MNTYITEQWIDTYRDRREIKADSIECVNNQTLFWLNKELVAAFPNTIIVYLK